MGPKKASTGGREDCKKNSKTSNDKVTKTVSKAGAKRATSANTRTIAHVERFFPSNDVQKLFDDWVRNVKPSEVRGSFDKGSWERIHGDGKSSVQGRIHAEAIASSDPDKQFQVKVVYNDSVIILKSWWTTEPELADVGREFKKHYFK